MSTSRIGRKPVLIPSGVDVKVQAQKVTIKGPKGQLSMEVHPFVSMIVEKDQIKIQLATTSVKKITGSNIKLRKSIAGTVRSNVQNIVRGVTQGFERKLMLVGVGYRAQAKGKLLSLSLGFSHATDFPIPEGITIETPTQTDILIKGICKKLVGLVAATIRSIRPPEPYKGKGVRYANEIVEIKETKKK